MVESKRKILKSVIAEVFKKDLIIVKTKIANIAHENGNGVGFKYNGSNILVDGMAKTGLFVSLPELRPELVEEAKLAIHNRDTVQRSTRYLTHLITTEFNKLKKIEDCIALIPKEYGGTGDINQDTLIFNYLRKRNLLKRMA